MKKDKQKPKFVDDGHTIYSMDGLDPYGSGGEKKPKANLQKKEFWAAVKAGFAVFFPKMMLVVGCFALVAFLLWLWLL